MIRAMTKCKIISRFGIGVDNVDIEAATTKGIVVTKVPDYCIDEVSDHAMALLLSARPQDSVFERAVHRRDAGRCRPWCRFTGCAARCWALVGFGQIPQLVAPKAKAFGMRVVAFDPFVPQGRAGTRRGGARGVRGTAEDLGLHFAFTPAAARDAASVQRGCRSPDEAGRVTS